MSRPACASAPPYFNAAAASRWLVRSLFVTVDPGTTGVRLNATVLRVCCWAGLRNRSASRWRVPGLASSRWILLLCAVVPWPGWSLLSSATDRFFGMRVLAMTAAAHRLLVQVPPRARLLLARPLVLQRVEDLLALLRAVLLDHGGVRLRCAALLAAGVPVVLAEGHQILPIRAPVSARLFRRPAAIAAR